MSIKISALPGVTSFGLMDQIPVNSKLTGAFVASTISYPAFLASMNALYQPKTGELTVLGALTSTTLGRNMLEKAHDTRVPTFPRVQTDGAVTLRTATNMLGDIGAQPASANLTTLAATSPTTAGLSLLEIANPTNTAYVRVNTAGDAAASGLTSTEVADDLRPYLVKPRVYKIASFAATFTPNTDLYDVFVAYGLTEGIIFAAPSGSPSTGQRLLFRIKDNGSAPRSLTWTTGAHYRGTTLPTITVVGTTHYIEFVYNSDTTQWEAIAITALT